MEGLLYINRIDPLTRGEHVGNLGFEQKLEKEGPTEGDLVDQFHDDFVNLGK